MAVYKLFAEKDTTIYSEYDTKNTGMDEILELTKEESVLHEGQSTTSRILIKFSQEEIEDIFYNKIGNKNFDVYLKMYVACADSLPVSFNVITYPSYDSWVMGTGRFGNIPETTDGCSWTYKSSSTGSAWTVLYPSNVTGSYMSQSMGGGSWYTSSFATQSITQYTKKDLDLKVTDIIIQYISSSIVNNGFIVMNSGSIEFDPNYTYKLNYFSRDTNTIYPPVLEFRWDDSSYYTGSSTVSENLYVVIKNNYVEFKEDAVHRFRLNAREQFPVRTFSTSSLYTTNLLLPSSSYFSIRDEKTNQVIIDFDDNYTKISSDSQSNYFDVYMNGLEPERYYRILIKTIINGNVIILDDQMFFKIEE